MNVKRIGQTERMLQWGLLALVLLASTQVLAQTSNAPPSASELAPQRVLFVGNSYLYYNDSLHNHVLRIVRELRPDQATALAYKSATIGGARLDHHNIDWLLGVGNLGIDQPFEAVVLQGGSFEGLGERNRTRFVATVTEYAAKIRAVGAEPLLYMTHAYVPPHRRGNDDLTATILDAYRQAADAVNARIIPVGVAFDASYQERPSLSLHQSFDGSHPNLAGTYLAACVVYLVLYGGDLAELDYDYFGRLPESDARYLRQVAERTVRQFADKHD